MPGHFATYELFQAKGISIHRYKVEENADLARIYHQ